MYVLLGCCVAVWLHAGVHCSHCHTLLCLDYLLCLCTSPLCHYLLCTEVCALQAGPLPYSILCSPLCTTEELTSDIGMSQYLLLLLMTKHAVESDQLVCSKLQQGMWQCICCLLLLVSSLCIIVITNASWVQVLAK